MHCNCGGVCATECVRECVVKTEVQYVVFLLAALVH